MSQVKGCSIEILGDREVFRPGESVTGIVTLEIEGELKISNIVIYCRGQALTKLYRYCQDQREVTGHETYLNEQLLLLSDSHPVTLTAGGYSYKFNFRLPSHGLPSSFEGSLGAVRYWLELELPPVNCIKFVRFFTVLDHVNVVEQVYKQTVQSHVTRPLQDISAQQTRESVGTLTLSASLNRTGYCPGEEISVSLEVTNDMSGVCGHVTASLIQQVDYHAGSESVYKLQTIRTHQRNNVGAGKTESPTNITLLVAAVPPSSVGRACQIIKVSYYIKVSVTEPRELDLKIPVTVGTAPAPTSQSRRSTYFTRCQLGVEPFPWSEGTFVNPTCYTPQTLFISTDNPDHTAVTNLQKGVEASRVAEATPTRSQTPAARKEAEIASAKYPPPDDTPAKQLYHYRSVPSAPPVHVMEPLEPPPPSYDQACPTPKEAVPIPYYVPLQTGNGCVLLLQFPCQDTAAVSDCFKSNVPNMLLHDGKVLAFFPEIKFFPSFVTSALVIHFGAERTALSWLHTIKSLNPELTSRWWGLITENKTAKPKPGDLKKYKVLSIIVLKQNADFVRTKEYTEEHAQLMTDVLNPAKKKYGVLNIVSGKPVFACGDWNSFPATASELTFNVSQFENSEQRSGYTQEYATNTRLRRFSELSKQSSEVIFIYGSPTGDIWRFQDL